MIEGVYEPTDEPKRPKTPEEIEAEQKRIEYLNSLPWQPFDVEW